MNDELVLKMQNIEREFKQALQVVPTAIHEGEVTDVVLNGYAGICIRGSRHIWGVSKREYMEYYGIV